MNDLPAESCSHNPYAAPTAAVIDTPEVARERPSAVRRALILLWLSMVLGLIGVGLDWGYLMSQLPLLFLITYEGVMVALFGFLIIKIAAGRNWARITILILDLLCLLPSVQESIKTVPRAPVVAVLELIVLGLDFTGLYLLFFPGRAFFKRLPR